MKKMIEICAAVALLALPSFGNEVAFNLMGRFLDNGNIVILGEDNVEREAVLLTPEEYANLTNGIAVVRAYLESVKEYRIKLHGKVVKKGVDIEKKCQYEIYEDGYRFEEPMLPVHRRLTATITTGTNTPKRVERPATRPSNMSTRRWELQKKVNESKGKTKTVNMIHDAATGKDIIAE